MALGDAPYAVKGVSLAAPGRPDVADAPSVGENSSGPLAPGLLSSGQLGTIVRKLQASFTEPDLE
jgi:hypothetical protein